MTKRILIIALTGVMAASGVVAQDSQWEGLLRLGGIAKDETGNRLVMQETFNIYDGFSIPKIYLNGRFNERNYLRFDLTDFNQDNRRGYLEYRMPGFVRVYSNFTQSAQVFDPIRATESERKNFFVSAKVTPSSLARITGDYRLITRRGDRIGYPDSVMSSLGTQYDYDHHYGRLEVELKTDRVGGTIAIDASKVSDALDEFNDREGRVVSANVFLPGILTDRLTHVARGAIGESELPTSDVKYTMYMGQYNGILAIPYRLQFKYRLYGSRVDDEATGMFTDNFSHDFDLVYRDRWGSVAAGYGWEALDDDRSVTTYDNLRGALYLRMPDNTLSGSVTFASRDKEDKEKQTLLQDTETTRVRAKLDYRPKTNVTVGGSYAERTRDLNDISAKIEGSIAGAYASYSHDYSGGLGDITGKIKANYQYADDDYSNRDTSEYKTTSHFITGTIEAQWEKKLDLGFGGTYMDIGEDLDIEKSILSFWAGYTFLDDWEVRAKYNVYNYDDFILTSRFYTANIVWFDIGYHFDVD